MLVPWMGPYALTRTNTTTLRTKFSQNLCTNLGQPWLYVGMPDAPRERSGLSQAVAAQIRAERSAARLTIEQTAKKARIPYSTFRKLDDGTGLANADQLGALCSRVWGITLAEFFARVERRLATRPDDHPHPPNG